MFGNNLGVDTRILTLKTRLGINFGGLVSNDAIDINNKTRKIYIGGTFTHYNGVSRTCIARLNEDGSLDTSFRAGVAFNAGSQISSIKVDQSTGSIFVGGSFTTYSGATNNRIIKILPSGYKDTTFDNSTGFNTGRVTGIVIDGSGNIYCLGTFTQYKGVTANRIIKLNGSTGAKDTSFDNTTGFDAEARCGAIDVNGKLYVGGDFVLYKSTTYQRIIRLNTDGSIDTGFDSIAGFNTAGNYILHINIDSNGKIYCAGGYTTYKSVAANRIIRLNTDGTKDTGFDNTTGFSAETDRVVFDRDGKIYVCGIFTLYKSVAALRIIKLNTDGSKDSSLDNSVGFPGFAVVAMIYDSYNHRLLCGGTFDTYRSNREYGFTRINLGGISDTRDSAQYGYRIFTANSSFVLPVGVSNLEYLIVGAGGSGGGTTVNNSASGGGGGGEVKAGNISNPPAGTYTITVGSGGLAIANTSNNAGFDGGISLITYPDAVTEITAQGGRRGAGGGDVANNTANNEGGGGGSSVATFTAGGTGTNAGGSGTSTTAAGGGGGSGGAGSTASSTTATPNGGGAGVSNSISLAAVTYGVGGGSFAVHATARNGTTPTANTGNGSSGRNRTTTNVTGAAGAAGIIIVKWTS